jgi:sulfatase maturation enzyme AslB (radical SAM superfamily)
VTPKLSFLAHTFASPCLGREPKAKVTITIITDQDIHFINDAIKYFTDHFILRHINFIIYYSQGNGQAKSTNKVFGTSLTKLVNENKNY